MARSYHLNSAWPNWHRMPQEQLPFFQKPLHFLFLELVLTAWMSSCRPWANLHLWSQGHWPSSEKVLHSYVLCLAGLVLGQNCSSSLSEELSSSVVCRDRLSCCLSFSMLMQGWGIQININNSQVICLKYLTKADILPISQRLKTYIKFTLWSLLLFYADLNRPREPDLQNNMSKPSKEGTKNTLIIFPNTPQDQPQLRRDAEPDVLQMSNFDGNIDTAINYYISQINKLCTDNNKLSQQLRKALEEKKELADMIASFEEISKDDTDEKKKRVRRCANEIERKYICQVRGCEKSYGTEGSMAQHMKLKHPEIDYVMQNSSGDHRIGKDGRRESEEEYEEDQSARD